MGSGLASAIAKVVDSTEEGSAWARNGRGPVMRRLFGAYKNTDLWGVYRKYRKVDYKKSGFINYEELGEVILDDEHNLINIWDMFSMQDELMYGQQLLVVVCLFSSAPLRDKGRFLLTLFDTSATGIATGAELSNLCVGILGILGRCTATPVIKGKDIVPMVREQLPRCLNEYKEALGRHKGSEADFFENVRVVGQAEMDKLCSTLEGMYEELPISGPPPEKSKAPPPPDWGKNSHDAAGGGVSAVRNLAGSRSQALKAPMEADEDDMMLAGSRSAPTLTEAKRKLPPAGGWFVVSTVDFETVEKDMAAFRQCFIHGVSKSLGLPAGCVEVVSITKGSVVVEFLLHPAGRGSDKREGEHLLHSLEEQMMVTDSDLRRGRFGAYAKGADLRVGATRLSAKSRLHLGSGQDELHLDASTQANDVACTLEEVLAMIEDTKRQVLEAEAARDAVIGESVERDRIISEVKFLEELEQKKAEEEEAERQRILNMTDEERAEMLAEAARLEEEVRRNEEALALRMRQLEEEEAQRLKEEEAERLRLEAEERERREALHWENNPRPREPTVFMPPNQVLFQSGCTMPFMLF